jgi:glycosyltransferase involved in cell wall biosynthesis
MISVLTIGYGKNIFDPENPERTRLRTCARKIKALHMIIFAHGASALGETTDGNLHLYPINTFTRLGMLVRAYRKSAAILRARKDEPWLISSQDPFETGLVGFLLHLRYGVPLQVQEHGDFFGTSWWRRESLFNRVRYIFGSWLVRRASCVRTVSQRAREHLVSVGVPRERISELSVAIDTEAFLKTDVIPPSENLRAKYPDSDFFILGIGRLVRQKRFDVLIESFSRLVHSSARLVIIGSGPEEMRLKEKAHRYGVSDRVSFIPWTSHLPVYLQQADLFVLSSAYEGWARVILEAMASGIPAVVTEVGCAGEVFLDGVHGAIVPVGDVGALSVAVSELLDDAPRRKRMGLAARAAVEAYARHQRPYAEAWAALMERCGTANKV